MFLRPGKKHRQYAYRPRFYRPEEDEAARRVKRIRFRSSAAPKSGRRMARSIMFAMAAILFVVWLIQKLQSAGY